MVGLSTISNLGRKKLVAANFKMNFNHLEMTQYVQKLSWLLRDSGHDFSKVEVVLLPSFTNLRSVQVMVDADKLDFEYGAQDISMHKDGSFTGEISARQLKSLGVTYSLVSHTERRNLHCEDDVVMMRKATKALEYGIKPIICIGEIDEEPREVPDFEFLHGQLRPIINRINSIGKNDVIPFLENNVIAYEPRWAVANGHPCSPNFINEVMTGLRSYIADEIGVDNAYKIRLVYGGSVNLKNIGEIVGQNEVDGVLVGKAALDSENFSKMIRVARKTISDHDK